MAKRVVVLETVVRRKRSDAEPDELGLNDICRNPWVRFLAFELPVFAFLLSLLILLKTALYVHGAFIHPYLKSLEWTTERILKERTYPSFDCASDPLAVTLETPDDLYLSSEDTSSADAAEFVMQHGGAVFPNLIPKAHARELREYLLTWEFISGGRQLPLITNEDRFSKGLTGTEHPSLPKVLHSISSNVLLRETLERLLGPNPAILAFSTIIAQSGAEHQNYHVDKPPDGSSMQFAHSFIPNYALLIPLQDTTSNMGATAICPGTHRCNEMNRSYAEERGFHAVKNNETGVWPTGHGLLYNAQVRHRGSAHTGEDVRVVLIVTFGSRPRLVDEDNRALPLLPLFAMRWDMWGFTLNDMLDANTYMQYPWLRSLGIWKHDEADWGWTILEDWCAMFVDREYSRLGEAIVRRLQNDKVSWLTMVLFPYADIKTWKQTDRVGAPYEWFLVEYVRRLGWFVFALLVTTFFCYYGVVTRALKLMGGDSLGRLVAICIMVSILASLCIARLHTLEFWSYNKHRRYENVPSLHLPLPDSKKTLIENPNFQDVLLSSALQADDSLPLFAYARVLDYHEGNRHWHAAVSMHLEEFSRLNKPRQDKIVRRVLVEATAKGKAERFLKQVKGGWIEIDHTDALEATRVLLSSKAFETERSCDAT